MSPAAAGPASPAPHEGLLESLPDDVLLIITNAVFRGSRTECLALAQAGRRMLETCLPWLLRNVSLTCPEHAELLLSDLLGTNRHRHLRRLDVSLDAMDAKLALETLLPLCTSLERLSFKTRNLEAAKRAIDTLHLSSGTVGHLELLLFSTARAESVNFGSLPSGLRTLALEPHPHAPLRPFVEIIQSSETLKEWHLTGRHPDLGPALMGFPKAIAKLRTATSSSGTELEVLATLPLKLDALTIPGRLLGTTAWRALARICPKRLRIMHGTTGDLVNAVMLPFEGIGSVVMEQPLGSLEPGQIARLLVELQQRIGRLEIRVRASDWKTRRDEAEAWKSGVGFVDWIEG